VSKVNKFEVATERVWVKASPEIVKELRAGWSRSVQAHITHQNPDGSWEMVFRTFTPEEARNAEPYGA
jgi:hypothetical protein